ncbi:MAG TPA: DUF4350 domain-containing protein [Lacunisphaera sp.]|jgi:hypothetical protein
MNALRRWFPPVAVALLLLVAIVGVFQLRIGGGELYPEYSSLRADALGTRALYDALAQVPGITVDRDYRPLAKLGTRPRVVLMPGLLWQQWQSIPANQLAALDAAANDGARIVLAFRADQKREDRDKDGRIREDDEKTKAREEKAQRDAKVKKESKKLKTPEEKELEPKALAKAWGVTFKQRWLMSQSETAERADGVSTDLRQTVAWHSDLYFAFAGSDWRVLYRRAEEPVLVEKTFGRGSIVLVADAYCLSNEAMHRERATSLLSWLVADYRRVTFLEGPLGVLEENGLGSLARRYGLGGAMALCALLGGLYAWRQLVAFMPPMDSADADGAEALAYEPAAGMTNLLRRSLGAADLLPTCVEEWRKARRAGRDNSVSMARLESAWAARDPKKSLYANYNELARTLKPR